MFFSKYTSLSSIKIQYIRRKIAICLKITFSKKKKRKRKSLFQKTTKYNTFLRSNFADVVSNLTLCGFTWPLQLSAVAPEQINITRVYDGFGERMEGTWIFLAMISNLLIIRESRSEYKRAYSGRATANAEETRHIHTSLDLPCNE